MDSANPVGVAAPVGASRSGDAEGPGELVAREGLRVAWLYSVASLGIGFFYGFNNATLPLILNRFTESPLRKPPGARCCGTLVPVGAPNQQRSPVVARNPSACPIRHAGSYGVGHPRPAPPVPALCERPGLQQLARALLGRGPGVAGPG